MKSNKSIQVKAALLMIVFSLNTLIGFACAVGVNMGFNSDHHNREEKAVAVKTAHHHDHAGHHHKKAATNKKEKENCCNDQMMKFIQLDKSIPQSVNIAIHPIFFTALLSIFYYIDTLYTSPLSSNVWSFVRSYHPPIANIRIAIQSFQI